MKISLIGPVYPFRGGIAHHTSQLAASLEENGHEVNLFSFKSQYPKWLYPGKTDQDPSQMVHKKRASFTLSAYDPISWIKTSKNIENEIPDLVIFQWWITFWAPTYIALAFNMRRKGLPSLFLIHNTFPHEGSTLDKWLARAALGQADYFLVQSLREKKRILNLFPDARIEFCPLPPFHFLMEKRIPTNQAKTQLGTDSDLPLILFFGFVRPYKGLAVLLESIVLLRKWGNPARLVVAGEIWKDKEIYENFIADRDLNDLVHLQDRYIPNEEVGLFFSAADVFVASHIEGTQSGALTIAIAHELPIVATEAIVEAHHTESYGGIKVVPPDDPIAMAQEILGLLGSSDSRSKKKSDPSFSANEWDSMVRTIEGIIEQSI